MRLYLVLVVFLIRFLVSGPFKSSPLLSLVVVSFVMFLPLFLEELGLFLAASLCFLCTVSPLPYRFVVTHVLLKHSISGYLLVTVLSSTTLCLCVLVSQVHRPPRNTSCVPPYPFQIISTRFSPSTSTLAVSIYSSIATRTPFTFTTCTSAHPHSHWWFHACRVSVFALLGVWLFPRLSSLISLFKSFFCLADRKSVV